MAWMSGIWISTSLESTERLLTSLLKPSVVIQLRRLYGCGWLEQPGTAMLVNAEGVANLAGCPAESGPDW